MKKWFLLFPLTFILSFGIYRLTDENLNELAAQLREPDLLSKQPVLSSFMPTLSSPDFKSMEKLNSEVVNVCAKDRETQFESNFIRTWSEYSSKNSDLFQFLLNNKIQQPLSFRPDSMTGYQEQMKGNKIWIRHFELHICYLDLTNQKTEATRLLQVLIRSTLKSFEMAQPFAQTIQSLRLLNSALLEIDKLKSPLSADITDLIGQLGLEKISFLGTQFHFQSVLNSIENLKAKMMWRPQVYLPTLLIQPARLMNQMAQITQSGEPLQFQPDPNAPWYDVRNLELIYLSLFQRSVLNQKEQLEQELFELKELATDLSRKGLKDNDKSSIKKTK